MNVRLSSSFQIGDRLVGKNAPCFVVAEAGIAHFGEFSKAIRLVDVAAEARADAVKFQIFDVDALIARDDPHWRARLASRALKLEDFREIKTYCDERRIIFFATAHDVRSFDFLTRLDPPVYKVGSGEYLNWPYLRQLAATGKPVLFSTGMYSEREVIEAVNVMANTGNNEIAVLQCTTRYPTPPDEVNLRVMDRYRELFGGVIGYSDHTAGYHIPLAAVARGAKIVEKHISIDFNVPHAQDWKVSSGPQDLIDFVRQLRDVETALGKPEKTVSVEEAKNASWARKSLVSTRQIEAGEIISADMIISKRPGTGIAPSEIGKVQGRRATETIPADTVLSWSQLN